MKTQIYATPAIEGLKKPLVSMVYMEVIQRFKG